MLGLRAFLLVPLLTLSVGCTAQPARFPTVTTLEESTREDVALAPEQAPPITQTKSALALEHTARLFVLALENRSAEQLQAILSESAVVRPHSGGSGTPALPALLSLTPARSNQGVTPPGAEENTIRARLVDVDATSEQPHATLEVTPPSQLHGRWQLIFAEERGQTRISKILLPKSR